MKKAVNWALRQIGKRNRALNVKAVALSRRLAHRQLRRRRAGSARTPCGNSRARWCSEGFRVAALASSL